MASTESANGGGVHASVESAATRLLHDLVAGQNEVLELIARGEALRPTLDKLLRVIEAQCPDTLSSILLLDPDGVHLRHGATPRLPESFTRAIDGEPIGPRAGSCGTAAFRREAVIVEDIADDPLWDEYRAVALEHGLRACWSTPILDAEQRVLGTFALYFRTTGRPDERHRRLIAISTDIAAIAIVRDLETQRMRRREAQLAEAQRIAQLGSYEWDPATNTVARSDELCRIFGVPPDEFEPTFEGYIQRVHPEDRGTTRSIIERAFRDSSRFEFEERIVQPGGAIRLLRSQGNWIADKPGGPKKLVGICQDITERRQAEEQIRRTELLQAKNEELKAFAYTVSHDLKAPLRGIAGYARELDRRHRPGLDDRALWCVTQILTATSNLDCLIEDLLQYSRLDAETPVLTDVDLAATIEGILNDRKPVILEQRTDVALQVPAARLRTWERGLVQLMTNLIDNALKYTRTVRHARVEISSCETRDCMRIAVADNGIGFDMKHHDRIFGLFNRLVTPEEFEGTGAGLAIAKKVVEKMGGRISATSTPGSGATFVVELPHDGAAAADVPLRRPAADVR
jgi:PAS domain S-box-containing protein